MIRAYAKINLGLLVLENRPDGYHNIETVFHKIDLHDEITLEPSPSISVVCSSPNVPSDTSNICFKAATLLQEQFRTDKGVKIFLQKNIPVGAGLGGGSSDAAAILRELPKLWERSVDEASLRSLALKLGSDVPYFLGTGSAVARGRGEILEYFKLDVPYTIVLCYPNIHISTAWAYRNVIPHQTPVDLKEILIEGMKSPIHLGQELRNEFEPLVFKHYPEVLKVKQTLMRGGASYASMSGSGSSVFGLFAGSHEANAVVNALRSRDYLVSMTRPHFVA